MPQSITSQFKLQLNSTSTFHPFCLLLLSLKPVFSQFKLHLNFTSLSHYHHFASCNLSLETLHFEVQALKCQVYLIFVNISQHIFSPSTTKFLTLVLFITCFLLPMLIYLSLLALKTPTSIYFATFSHLANFQQTIFIINNSTAPFLKNSE